MPATTPPRFWNVPNTLTVGRLALSVAVFGLIAAGAYAAALVVFVIAAITDALDGYLARKLGQETPLGRQLDPLVDKVIVAGAYIHLLTLPEAGIHPWMVTTIVIRELLIQGLRSHLEGQGQAFGAKTAGKIKTLFQCLSISAILVALAAAPAPGWLVVLRDALTWAAVLLTLYSGLGYVFAALPSLKREHRAGTL
ncbi:MAG: CDP-diacylglycerol--glycerol-3-phosphate 3-phosphatidyltransferase [Thermoleophilia bacterium]|nr:CDP-diacylglycerol--glycerol-3-phosphate 3-phosphatidyltransferase [Thermoleophilia bacterium]